MSSGSELVFRLLLLFYDRDDVLCFVVILYYSWDLAKSQQHFPGPIVGYQSILGPPVCPF
jgi:hypothetical protein